MPAILRRPDAQRFAGKPAPTGQHFQLSAEIIPCRKDYPHEIATNKKS